MAEMIPASMPTISPRRDIRRCFTDARRLSAGAHGCCWVVVISPDGTLVNVPVPSPKDADASLLRDVRAALSPDGLPVSELQITSINCTTGIQRRSRSFHRLLPLLPNLSYPIGAACLANNVVAFEGHADDFVVGCENADMLLVDDGMLPLLRPDWAMLALKTLRQPRIILFGRDGRLSKVDGVKLVEK